jgi:Lamin Tail Domain
MDRSRRAGSTALIVLVLAAVSASWASPGIRAGAVSWPTSSLVLSELQTGGSSASDEFVELANQGPNPVDLLGLEIVYATSSGSTVSRKATWPVSVLLDPGRRILLANGAGTFAADGDATYSGGFAATGGAIALRQIGGEVLDAIGWGDATNAFVEGSVAPAPPAGSSLERLPGGPLGNGVDTNDNGLDWFIQPAPSPQGSSAPAVPGDGLPPTPTPTPTPTPVASPTAIAGARALADGVHVTIAGTLTTDLGSLESGRGGFVQDDSGGIAIYLDASVAAVWPAGTTVTLSGTIASRYAQRTLDADESSIVSGPIGTLPPPIDVAAGAVGESLEGTRVRIAGTISGPTDQLSDGIAVNVDDGTGVIRAVMGPDALGTLVPVAGSAIVATGPLGQRDSSGTGMSGYRIHATLPGEIAIATPQPTPTPSPSPTPTPTPTATSTPGPTPSATPAPTSDAVSLLDARSYPIGATIHTSGIVVAEAGRLGTPTLLGIAAPDAGLVVHLPAGLAGYPRGTILDVAGKLAAPYGQSEIRPAVADVRAVGSAALPTPVTVPAAGLDESLEGRLLTFSGRLTGKPKAASSGDLTYLFDRDGTIIKVMSDGSSRISATSVQVDATYRIVGFVGQRASRIGALDGYRVWVRDAADLALISGPTASPSQPASNQPSSSTTKLLSIARALKSTGADVKVDGVVTAPASLLDSTGRRIVIQDSTAAVEVLLPTGTAAASIGSRIRVDGTMGVAYGAPRLRATRVTVRGTGTPQRAAILRSAPRQADEWRLVSISGKVEDLTKLGDRWRAEIRVGTATAVVVGQPGAGIPSSSLVEGRTATVVGIVRRPYPTATDRRFAVTPRYPADVRMAKASGSTGGSPSRPGISPDEPGQPVGPTQPIPTDADMRDLDTMIGKYVRVGGLVDALRADGFSLDDGTAVGRIRLSGSALDQLPLIEPGDALNVTGTVETTEAGPQVAVAASGGLVVGGDPVAAASPPAGLADGRTASVADPGEAISPASMTDPTATDAVGTSGGRVAAVTVGVALLAVISAAALAGIAIRRSRRRRRMLARISARLATIAGHPRAAPSGLPAAGPAPPPEHSIGVIPVERGPSTIQSA